jgi:molecular chaperone GrpE
MSSKHELHEDNTGHETAEDRVKQVAEEIAAEAKKSLESESDDAYLMQDEEEHLNIAGADDSQKDEEIAKLKDQLLRAVAETENIRKRAERDVADARKYGITGFARDLIAVGENLQMALDNIPDEARQTNELLNNLATGIDMTAQELQRVYQNHGIKRINPQGEKFDHNFHQAVAHIEDAQHEAGTVVQVLQAGYVIADRLLRPAMVTVAKQVNGSDKPALDTEA